MSDSAHVEQERSELIAMIRDSVQAVVPPGGDLRRIRLLRFATPGFDRGTWREMCGMGWPALRLPEGKGGSNLGLREYCALLEGLGAGLVPEPLIGAATAARFLEGAPLAGLLAGERVVLPAWQEGAHSMAPTIDTHCRGGRVSGRKVFVAAAGGADAYVVTTASGPVWVERAAPGVTLQLDATQDGGQVGTLVMDDAPCQALSGDVAEALDEAALATSAYLLGVTERAFALTLDYLRMRKQFGRLIGSFQALQHRAVDLKIQLALMRASVESAAALLDAGASAELRQAVVSRAKVRAADAAMLVTRQAIQLHGAIGYTDEFDVGLYLRKAMALAHQYGSTKAHRARYAQLLPAIEEA
jgi:alkylation response protein AidB-like acyl-CoA dehydrogenase